MFICTQNSQNRTGFGSITSKGINYCCKARASSFSFTGTCDYIDKKTKESVSRLEANEPTEVKNKMALAQCKTRSVYPNNVELKIKKSSLKAEELAIPMLG